MRRKRIKLKLCKINAEALWMKRGSPNGWADFAKDFSLGLGDTRRVWDWSELIYMIAALFSHVMLMQCSSNLQLGEKSITPQAPFSSLKQELFSDNSHLGHMTMGASCNLPIPQCPPAPHCCRCWVKTWLMTLIMEAQYCSCVLLSLQQLC